MYNVENRGDGCTMLRIEGWMYNVENGGDPMYHVRIEGMDVQC